MSDGAIIDGHAHACGNLLTVEGVCGFLDAAGADRIVLCPARLSPRTYALPDLARHAPRRDAMLLINRLLRPIVALSRGQEDIDPGNAHVRSLVEAAPDRVLQFYWVLVNAPSALERLEACFREWAFVGLKVHQCWERFRFSEEPFRRVARFAADKGLPLFIHAHARSDVEELIAFLVAHPEVTVIAAHLIGLEAYIDAGRDLPNLYFDLSSPPLVSRERLLAALRRFGAGRVMLGSDAPFGRDNLRLGIERVRGLPIDEEDKAQVLGRTMQRLLRI